MSSRIDILLCHIFILVICAILLGAFSIQFGMGEFPCPLCLLQRMCMILSAIGPAYVIARGRHRRHTGMTVLSTGLGLAILAAVGGMAVATRQDLLHIEPGTPGYGSPIFGLHLYTWALLVFVCIIIASGLMLVFGAEYPSSSQATTSRKRWYTTLTLWLFGAIILANAIVAFMESGFNLFLPDNPEHYELLRQLGIGTGSGGSG